MSLTRTASFRSLFDVDVSGYRCHAVHEAGRSYPETNCYTDVLIELLHARGDEPLAVLGCLLRSDFEGDQWTFFKPSADDLESLLGIDIHEMQPHRPLPLQIAEQLAFGRTIIVELDAFHLPDTAATSYRREHIKTSVAAEAIDVERGWLRYFHGTGLHELEGDDFAGAMRLAGTGPELPPYTELVRFDAGERLEGGELRAGARAALMRHLARRPRENPFEPFGAALADELPKLLDGGPDAFHAYAFATVRMVGAAFELAADQLRWLHDERAELPAAAMSEIVEGCKLLGFRLARRRAFEPEPLLESLADAWTRAMSALEGVVG